MDALLASIDFCFTFVGQIMDVVGSNDILSLFILLVIVYLFIAALTGGKAEK